MKIVFMGTPEFAVPVLRALAEHHEIVCIYTQPPRRAGQGMKLRCSPVHVVADELDIPVRCPVSLKNSEEQAYFASLNADAAVVCAYGLLLPQAVLDAPKLGCINVHASLLPRWRGAAPIQRAIEAGDEQSGVTVMQMEAGLDTGPMLLKKTVEIFPDMTGGQLHDALAEAGAEAIIEALANPLNPVPQPNEGMTYAAKLTKEETAIDWDMEADDLKRKIQAFNPFPAMYFMYKGERIRVFDAYEDDTATTQVPGTVVDDGLLIACGKGTTLRPLILQRAGKKPMPVADFLRGCPIEKGTKLAV